MIGDLEILKLKRDQTWAVEPGKGAARVTKFHEFQSVAEVSVTIACPNCCFHNALAPPPGARITHITRFRPVILDNERPQYASGDGDDRGGDSATPQVQGARTPTIITTTTTTTNNHVHNTFCDCLQHVHPKPPSTPPPPRAAAATTWRASRVGDGCYRDGRGPYGIAPLLSSQT